MPNLRLQSTLKHHVDAVCKENDCISSIGFIRLMLQQIFGLDDSEIDESITDGAMDRGIDAIFEQENEDGENILYVVQSKYFGNPDNSLEEDAINKACLAVSNYIFGEYPIESLNVKLKRRMILYRDRLSNGSVDQVALIFITNGQRVNHNLIVDLDRFKDQQIGQLKYEIYTEIDLAQIFAPVSALPIKQIDLKIAKDVGGGDKAYIPLPDIDYIQGRVVKVDVCDLAKIVQENPNIFHSNVRAYQSIRNKVNEVIAATLSDEVLVREFIYLNNGITLLCDNFEIKPGNEVVSIYSPAIINGCQTASTIAQVSLEGKIFPNTAFVLMRVIKSKNDEVKRRIIISSNTQTVVKNRDLISEDPIQKELESQFQMIGYYYERKRGLHVGRPPEKVIDLERAAQYYLALYLQKPAEAKNKKSEIYKSYKDQIFNKDITANQLLVGYVLFTKINDKIKQLRKSSPDNRKSILGNSALHLLTLFNIWAIEGSGKFLSELEDDISLLNDLFESDFTQVLKKFERSIEQIQKKEGSTFNPQYFFKSPDSLEKILLQKTISQTRKTKEYLELNASNVKRQKDLRYYKPDEFSFDGKEYQKIKYWNDLFYKLMESYERKFGLNESGINIVPTGSRKLLLLNPDDAERKLRKKMRNGLWLLTNFNSNYLSKYCFLIAKKLNIDLIIRLRPTRFRVEKKFKKRK